MGTHSNTLNSFNRLQVKIMKTSEVPSKFNLHVFSAEISDKRVLYQVLKMKDSVMVIINYKNDLKLFDLSLAMRSRYDKLPISTRLLGDFQDDTSLSLASKVSKFLNKTVYVSCNMDRDRFMLPFVERQLFQEIRNYPDKF